MMLPLSFWASPSFTALAMPNHMISKVEPLDEYHLLDLGTGLLYGGFASLEAARIIARERGLASWQIFHGNKRIEHHDPDSP